MLTSDQINRINELAAKSKTTALTPEETEEQFALRQMYINQVRNNMKSVLDNTVIQDPDGSKRKLKPKSSNKRKN